MNYHELLQDEDGNAVLGPEVNMEDVLTPEGLEQLREDEAVLEDFKTFWGALVTTDGHLDAVKVAKELYDYHRMMQNTSAVFYNVTQGRISKPNTIAADVISEHDDVCHADCGGEP